VSIAQLEAHAVDEMFIGCSFIAMSHHRCGKLT